MQIVSQLIDGKFPDYQVIIPKGYKTAQLWTPGELLKACKQAGIIAREGSDVVRFHLHSGSGSERQSQAARAFLAETGESEIELDATVEGQELEIAFNVKFLQDTLEVISTKQVVIETNAHRLAGDDPPCWSAGHKVPVCVDANAY